MYKWSKHVKPIQTLWPVAYTCLYNVSWVTIHLVFQASLLMSGLLEMAASASSPSSSSFDLSWAQYDQEVALAELSQPPFEGFQATKTAVVQRQPPKLSLKPSLDYRLCREGISEFHWISQSFPQRKRRHPWCLRIITSDHRSCRELQGLPFSLKLLEDFEFFFQHLTMTWWNWRRRRDGRKPARWNEFQWQFTDHCGSKMPAPSIPLDEMWTSAPNTSCLRSELETW